jgi:hypothetical protein
MKKGQYQSPDSTRPSLGGKEGFDALFEHARRDAFTPEETERLWQSVMAAGPGGGGDAGPEISGGAAHGWTSGAFLKAAAALVLVGGLVAVAFVARRSGSPERVFVPSGTAETAQVAEAPRGEGSSPPVVSWEDLPRVHGPAPCETKPSAPAAPRGHNPTAPPEPPPPAEVSSAAPAPTAPSEPESVPPVAAPAPASPSEGALLLRARQQLVSDPASALELTDEAARRFPEGALVPEREVLAIEALTRLGRLPSARARFAAFRARYPQSPHLARLQSLLSP